MKPVYPGVQDGPVQTHHLRSQGLKGPHPGTDLVYLFTIRFFLVCCFVILLQSLKFFHIIEQINVSRVSLWIWHCHHLYTENKFWWSWFLFMISILYLPAHFCSNLFKPEKCMHIAQNIFCSHEKNSFLRRC